MTKKCWLDYQIWVTPGEIVTGNENICFRSRCLSPGYSIWLKIIDKHSWRNNIFGLFHVMKQYYLENCKSLEIASAVKFSESFFYNGVSLTVCLH